MSADQVASQRVSLPRLDALTGLRIFPALAVLLSHLERPVWAGPWLEAFLTAGYAGVTVFFVLSGFVLTYNYFDRFAEQPSFGALRSYIAARLARVYPLYILMLIWVSLPTLWEGKFRAKLWLEHALALQAWDASLSQAFTFNSPGWSISVELFLYACFPLLVWALLPVVRTPRRTLIALLVVAALMALLTGCFVLSGYADLPWTDPHSAHRWLYRNPLCRLGDFLLGMLTARLVAHRQAPPRRAWQHWGAAASAAAIVALMCVPGHIYTAASWDLSYALLAAVLIYCLASAPASAGARWLATKPLLLLGEASYALYLCHVYVVEQLRAKFLSSSPWGVYAGLTLLVVVASAIALHVVIERPSRAFFRRVLARDSSGRLRCRGPCSVADVSIRKAIRRLDRE